MSKNELSLSDVFDHYVVDDLPENWRNYAGIITGVEIIPSKLPGDYHCKITFSFKMKKKMKTGKKIYRNIFTTGRCEFQEIIEDFELMGKDAEGNEFLDLQELHNRFCVVSLNSIGDIKALSATFYDDENEKEMKLVEYLNEHVESGQMIDFAQVPSVVLHYYVIPMSYPYDEWQPGTEYHGCITNVTVEESDKPNEHNVKVTAYVFNGGTVKNIARYFNDIHSRGKADFDDFCYAFDMVNEDGSVVPQEAVGKLCMVELYENSKGNLYIRDMVPITVADDALKQYMLLIKMAKAYQNQSNF